MISILHSCHQPVCTAVTSQSAQLSPASLHSCHQHSAQLSQASLHSCHQQSARLSPASLHSCHQHSAQLSPASLHSCHQPVYTAFTSQYTMLASVFFTADTWTAQLSPPLCTAVTSQSAQWATVTSQSAQLSLASLHSCPQSVCTAVPSQSAAESSSEKLSSASQSQVSLCRSL